MKFLNLRSQSEPFYSYPAIEGQSLVILNGIWRRKFWGKVRGEIWSELNYRTFPKSTKLDRNLHQSRKTDNKLKFTILIKLSKLV